MNTSVRADGIANQSQNQIPLKNKLGALLLAPPAWSSDGRVQFGTKVGNYLFICLQFILCSFSN
jgi:hypothetical protein